MSQIDPELIFQDLLAEANTQKAKSLTALHTVLRNHYEVGERNFSIAEIARLSVANGGPSGSTIRNKTGAVYRQLIETWATYAGTTMKKPPNPLARSNKVPKDNELLTRISDPALRALFGQIIAERNRFRNELNTLKSQSQIVIDKRPVRQFEQPKEQSVEVLPSLSGMLTEMEVAALQAAVSDEFFEQQDWKVTRAGQVKGPYGEIYKHGYVNAIKKVLKEAP